MKHLFFLRLTDRLIKKKNCWHDEYGIIEYDAYLFGFIYLYHWAYGDISDGNFIIDFVLKIKAKRMLKKYLKDKKEATNEQNL